MDPAHSGCFLRRIVAEMKLCRVRSWWIRSRMCSVRVLDGSGGFRIRLRRRESDSGRVDNVGPIEREKRKRRRERGFIFFGGG